MAGAPLPAQEFVEADARDRPVSIDAYEELWRLGGVDAQSWDAFGSVASVAFGDDGGIVIHDEVGMRVLVVGPDGELVREIARRGEGPREFRDVEALVVARDGSFAVYDRSKRAFLRYSRSGEYETTVASRRSGNWGLGLAASANAGEAYRAVPVDSGSVREIERITLDSRRERSEPFYAAWRSAEQRLESDSHLVFYLGGEARPLEAFFPELRMDRLPDGGLLVVDSSAYELKYLDSAGSLFRVFRRAIDPMPTSDRIREARKAELRSVVREESWGILTDAFREAAASAIEIMKFYPELSVVAGVVTGWEGEVWVRRRGGDPFVEEGPADVVSSSGEYLGTFGPDEFPMPVALGPDGLAAFVETDTLDVATVVVARLRLEETTARPRR